MKKNIIAFLLVLLIASVLYFLFRQRGNEGDTIKTAGIVEGIEVNIAPKVSGRISEICCNEGDRISSGQTVVKIESDDLRASVDQASAAVVRSQAAVQAADSGVETAKANLRSAEAGIKSAEADLEMARVQMQEAKIEADRARELFKKEYISRSSLDQTVSVYDTAVAATRASEAKLNASAAAKNATTAQMNAAVSQLNASRSSQKEAEASLAFARSKLADATIFSPVSGTVAYKALETGETVNPGSVVLTLVELDNLYVRADIEETLVSYVTIGSNARVTIESMPGKVFTGKVYEIGRYAEFATQRDVTRGRQDIKTFRVKIKVQDKEGTLKPGMTVSVEIPKKK